MKRCYQVSIIVILFVISGVCGLMLSLHKQRVATQYSSSPFSTMETFHYPAVFVQQLKGDKRAGEKIFKEFCASCHAKEPQIDIKAPHIGDKKAWGEKMKWGRPALLNITIHGVGAMPARGGCFECSDEQLQATVDYILNHS